MFRTPSKKKDSDRVVQESRPNLGDKGLQNHGNASNTIPCGMFLEVEKWADDIPATAEKVSKEYARLRGGQGWIPLFVV